MKVLISGSRGLIGSALASALTGGGATVARLVRGAAKPDAARITWDPPSGEIDRAALEGFDAVIHLAGENIASGRWTAARKAKIRDSRIQGTRLLAEALSELRSPPQVFVSASAIGYYGNRGDEVLNENSKPGTGFLAEVCQEWERAADPASGRGTRVVHPRFGMVLSPLGGALGRMLTPFRLGAGGVVGSGKQWMSWISLDDAVGALVYCLENHSLSGPVNFVAPQAVTNRDFTRTLGQVLGRPTVLPAPAFALRLALGEMADALLLSSQRVEPARLVAAGYAFLHPGLEAALRNLLR